MANLPPKPTKIPAAEVGQYVVTEDPAGSGNFKLKTDAQLSGSIEVELSAQDGDNVALADATTGNKATVDDNKLNVKDTTLATNTTATNAKLDTVNTNLSDVKTKQDSGNTSLGSIDTKLSSQATAANQTSTNTKLDTVNTNLGDVKTKQDTGNTSLSSIDTKLSSQATAANQTSTNAKLDTVNTNLTTIDTDIKASQPRKIQDGAGNALTSSTVNSRQALDVHQADTSFIVSGLTATGVAPTLNPVSVSGVDGGGLKRHLLTDANGVLQAAITASALPTGAATATKQDTGNTSLGSIDTKLSSQATAANQTTGNTSLGSIDTKLSSQATAANQTSGNTSLSSIDTKLSSQSTAANQTSANTKLDTLNTSITSNKPVLRPVVDWDQRNMTLSVGNTVETYVYKLAGVNITPKSTYTVTFTDSTRTVVSSEIWST